MHLELYAQSTEPGLMATQLPNNVIEYFYNLISNLHSAFSRGNKIFSGNLFLRQQSGERSLHYFYILLYVLIAHLDLFYDN